jgi:hypothetical protein
MIYLIEYNRRKGVIVTFRTFAAHQREKAANARLAIELDRRRKGLDHEVVLLEAESKGALRRTHRRYFENAKQIVNSSTG